VAFPRFDALPVVVAGCIAIALLMVPAVVERAEAYAGSGGCSGGACSFCTNVTLQSSGSGPYNDRCAYGYFYQAYHVTASHWSGAVQMCAGMKSGSVGNGSNVGPVGVSCGFGYTVSTPSYLGTNTTGYMTIINQDNAPHYNYSGGGEYN
jgi:hypothetical protein